MRLTRLLPLLPAVLAVGCGGPKHSKAAVERGRTALTAALDAWKGDEPPDRLRALPDPVDYTDELRLTHKLLEYTLGRPNTTDPAVLRYPATLKLRDRDGQTQDRDVVFEVKLQTPVLIARDPYE
jgi:hypothetical protein